MDALFWYKISHWCYKHHLRPIAFLAKTMGIFLYKASIPYEAEIGKGTRVMHRGLGIVIHENTNIGKDCTIYHQVSIGSASPKKEVKISVKIGDNVVIGSGAKIITKNKITIGNNAKIGANAVVAQDVPPNSLAVGNPAQIKKKK